MPRSRLFWKLFVALGGVAVVGALVVGLVQSRWREQSILEQVDQRLRSAANLLSEDLAPRMGDGINAELQQRVCRLDELTGMRLTLVDMDGRVLADSSQESIRDVARLDNHRRRPEILRALGDESGATVRDSATLGEEYRYFARRVEIDDVAVGVLRVAVPMGEVAREVDTARRRVWGPIGAATLTALALIYAILRQILRPVAPLVEGADAISRGDYQHRVYADSRDELGELARALNRLSQEQNRRVSQLAQTSDHQSTVLAGMVEGVIAVDQRERIVLANKAAGRLFEFKPDLVVGRPLMEVVRSHALHHAVATAMFTRRSQRMETTREGTDRLIADVHVTPLPGDPCPGVVLVMHDTTELRRLESLRRDFVANVSHELKTPLSSIKAYAETLRDGAIHDPEASDRFLERIEEQADRLHRLILDMLMIARIESAQQVFEIEPVDVGEVVEACVEDRRQVAAVKQIELSIAPNQVACAVQADQEGLREILDNLVDNAIKYTPERGQVTVDWKCDRGVCRLSVVDTGIGIGAEDRKRVFERFFRADKARSRELGGTGLGLAIVKHLAQAFGGKVGVESEAGRGSTFWVELPVARSIR